MKRTQLVDSFAERPFFETRQVVAMFDEPEAQVQARLSRWVVAGKLIQLRRGRYLLPPADRRAEVSVYHLSNYLLRPSYVSLHSALEYHGLIPEAVAAVQALTPKHGQSWDTAAGSFHYRSIAQRRFFGYGAYSLRPAAAGGSPPVDAGQQSFLMARPEKALLDLFYTGAGEWDSGRIGGLRLQNLDQIDGDRVVEYAERFSSPRVTRAAQRFLQVHGADLSERFPGHGVA